MRFGRRQHQRDLRRRRASRSSTPRSPGPRAPRCRPTGRSADRSTTTGTPERVEIGDDRLEQAAEPAAESRCRESRRRSRSHSETSRAVQLPRLGVGDLDDRHADAAEDVEIGARVAADLGDAAEQETPTSTPRCSSVRATTKPSPPLLPRPQSTATRLSRRGPRTPLPSPPRPGGRRSPSARSTGCRCPRWSGDRPRASARC